MTALAQTELHIKGILLDHVLPLSVLDCNAKVAPEALCKLNQNIKVGEFNEVRLYGGDHNINSLEG